MKELDFYPTIINELSNPPYNCRCYLYGTNGFMPLNHKKRFDILVFHSIQKFSVKHLPQPFALEVKRNDSESGSFGEISKGLYEQVSGKYKNLEFTCPKENWKGVLPFAFTTINAFQGKPIYEKHYPEASTFFIERFSWRMGVKILRKINGKLYLTFNGQATCLDGSFIGWKEFNDLWRAEEILDGEQ